MQEWIAEYIEAQKGALDSISPAQIGTLVDTIRRTLDNGQGIFVCGNGGSAAIASHFATDLGKGASDALGERFRIQSLNDNVSWMTALANDYSYAEVFVGQLRNFATSGDLLIVVSVSGSSPNVVKAVEWARDNGLRTIALIGGGRGELAELAEHVVVVDSTHFGRVEDAHMTICHLLAFAYMENP